MSRRKELAAGLAGVLDRVSTAAAASGRRPEGVTLVVVTKTWPTSDLRLLHELGVRDLGESRHQEAMEKAVALDGLSLRWHFIGQLQSNKAAAVSAYADTVHSVDSSKLVTRLNRGAQEHDRQVGVLIQVSLDPDEARAGRGGVGPASMLTIAGEVERAGGLVLEGVMGVAPLGRDPRPAYDRLRAASDELGTEHPAATAISAGMSGDFEVAIAAGATHVRVGSAVLGARPPLG